MKSLPIVFVTLGVAISYILFGISQVPAQAACCALPETREAETNVTLIDYVSQQDFSVPTLGGEIFTLSDQLGKPVVLFTMAYWCSTCISESKALSRLHDEYRDEIVILALDVDPNSTVPALSNFREFVGSPDYTWAFDEGGRVVQAYNIMALETTIIFDQHGEVVYTDRRSTSYGTLERQIRLLLD